MPYPTQTVTVIFCSSYLCARVRSLYGCRPVPWIFDINVTQANLTNDCQTLLSGRGSQAAATLANEPLMLTSSYQVSPVDRQLHKKMAAMRIASLRPKDSANDSKIAESERQRPRREHTADRLEECCRVQLDSVGQKSPPPRLISEFAAAGTSSK